MMQNIEINKLHNHPKNPRRDMGDLTELAESIKAQGILQNLTVVPWFSTITGVGADDPKQQEELGYFVVIGNRRLAAAKMAGLTELPCVISDMDYKTQLGTMLLENMQRSDLTIYEQAQGFQMMLDLGESVNDIAEKTGFSDTTIRRRVKLLELDQEKFKASTERNVSLMDYAELEKIRDIELKNKVLDSIGTSNFKYELQRAVDKEKSDKWLAGVVEQLSKFAIKVKDTPHGHQYVRAYYASRNETVEIPDDAGTIKYCYVISSYGYVNIYKECATTIQTEEDVVKKEKEEQQKARLDALKEITIRTHKIRREFAINVSNATAKKNIGRITSHSIKAMLDWNGDYYNADINDLADLLEINIEDETEEEKFVVFVDDEASEKPERFLFLVTYLSMDSGNEKYYIWNGKYTENKCLDEVYSLLEQLGYEMSDEEKKLMNGTHELFLNDEKDA